MKSKQFYQTTAWKTIAKYIKLYYANSECVVKCFTCGKFMQITEKECHAGHLIKVFDSNGTNFATAFEFTNLGVQCMQCNRFHGGRQDLMKDKLISIHGVGAIEKLYIQRHNYCKIDKFTLDYYEKLYKDLFDDLVKQKGNPWK